MRNGSAKTALLYLLLTLIGAALAVVGNDVLSRLILAQQMPGAALHAAVQNLTAMGALILGAPFIVLGLQGFYVAQRATTRAAVIFWCAGWVLLMALYWIGFADSQHAIAQKAWTAAALSVGLLPFLSIPLLIIALIAALYVRRKFPRT